MQHVEIIAQKGGNFSGAWNPPKYMKLVPDIGKYLHDWPKKHPELRLDSAIYNPVKTYSTFPTATIVYHNVNSPKIAIAKTVSRVLAKRDSYTRGRIAHNKKHRHSKK